MGPESVSLWLVILFTIAFADALVSGKYLCKVGKFIFKIAIAIAILALALAARNIEFATYLHTDLRYAGIIASTVIIFITLFDIAKVIIKSEEANYRRQRRRKGGTRRTTPARH